MERYSLMIVTDETKPIRRIDVDKRKVKRWLRLAIVAAVLAVVGLVDYVRVRIDHVELEGLRAETGEQRAQIRQFETTLSAVQTRLDRLRDFERKLRIIANLPGSTATGGADVTELDDSAVGDLGHGQGGDGEIDETLSGVGEPDAPAAASSEGAHPVSAAPNSPVAARVSVLRQDAERLGVIADARALSLKQLIDQLEGKHRRLAATPSIWPAKGWLTSRFGPRISPFTGTKQFHAGLDIAGRAGTPVIAPADGRVTFAGSHGPLGNSLIIDHGYGLRTLYGHARKLLVKRGDVVHRGQEIAEMGTTGRSTGPHLHYVVEVNGKAKNPLDFIFD